MIGLDSVVSPHTNKIMFSCLVTSNPVKMETSRSVIFTPTVNVI